MRRRVNVRREHFRHDADRDDQHDESGCRQHDTAESLLLGLRPRHDYCFSEHGIPECDDHLGILHFLLAGLGFERLHERISGRELRSANVCALADSLCVAADESIFERVPIIITIADVIAKLVTELDVRRINDNNGIYQRSNTGRLELECVSRRHIEHAMVRANVGNGKRHIHRCAEQWRYYAEYAAGG